MILTLLLTLTVAMATEPSCNEIRSYKDFYSCSLQKHPEFEISKLKLEEADAILDKASQWQNPDLEVTSLSGENAGESVKSTELSLSIPISQVWTRGAQKDIGRAEKKIVEIEAQESLLSVRKSLILDMYRVRQIEEELAIADESIAGFEKVKGQLRGRRTRGPEQEITLNLIELASSDYDLKKNQLNIEKAEINSRLKALWGPGFEIKKEFLPPLRKKWPEIVNNASTAHSFEVRKILAAGEKANAERTLAVRESWPTLSAGPTIEKIREGGSQYDSTGFNVSVSVPIFSFNGGARNLTETRSRQASLQADYAIKKAQLEKDILVQKYKSAVESLLKSAANNDVKRKHDRIDSLFKQGLASGSIVIEAHRQIASYAESQHQHEITALESYLEIQTLSGQNIEEILQ